MVVLALFACFAAVGVSAATVDSVSEVTLQKNQTDFEIIFTVNHSSAYAGTEFALQCADGVTVQSVRYSKSISTAGPVVARSFTWFSYYSGQNDYAGTVTVTVSFHYEGAENTYVVLDHISVYTRNGTKIDTDEQTLRKTVLIQREGATNHPEPADPPPSTTAPANHTDSNTPQPGTTSNHSGGDTSDNVTTTDPHGGATRPEATTNASGGSAPPTFEETNIDTQSAECSWPHVFMLILLIVSVLCNFVLGYFIYNKKLKINKNKQEDSING
jgi:hypothetical protein